jgi:hypothetical protein
MSVSPWLKAKAKAMFSDDDDSEGDASDSDSDSGSGGGDGDGDDVVGGGGDADVAGGGDAELKINPKYAARFNHNMARAEMHRQGLTLVSMSAQLELYLAPFRST